MLFRSVRRGPDTGGRRNVFLGDHAACAVRYWRGAIPVNGKTDKTTAVELLHATPVEQVPLHTDASGAAILLEHHEERLLAAAFGIGEFRT